MFEARQSDIRGDLLTGLHAHHHKIAVSKPLFTFLGQAGVKEAFKDDVRLMEEARAWVEETTQPGPSVGPTAEALDTYGWAKWVKDAVSELEPFPLAMACAALALFFDDAPLVPKWLCEDVQAARDMQLERKRMLSLPIPRLRALHSRLEWKKQIHDDVFGADHSGANSAEEKLLDTIAAKLEQAQTGPDSTSSGAGHKRGEDEESIPAGGMSGGPSAGNAGPAGTAAEGPGALQLEIAKRFKWGSAALPDTLWSARFGLELATKPLLERQCRETRANLRFKSRKKAAYVQSLLESPGEIKAVWEAFGLSLEELKWVCRRRFPGMLASMNVAATKEVLIRRLAEHEWTVVSAIKELRRLAKRRHGLFTPQETRLVRQTMFEARQTDIRDGLLEGPHAHHHKIAVSKPLFTFLGQAGVKKAFQDDVRLMEEARAWVEETTQPGPSVAKSTKAASEVCGWAGWVKKVVSDLKPFPLGMACAALVLFFDDAPLKVPGWLHKDVQAARDMKLRRSQALSLPIPQMQALESRLEWKKQIYSDVFGTGHSGANSVDDDLLFSMRINLREVGAAKYEEDSEEDSENEREAKKPRVEGQRCPRPRVP
eukprot:jgi/Mesvir1/2031/Mv11893-RA.1